MPRKFTLLVPILLAAQTPVIRVDTRLVEVNVIVRDDSGKPVEGLAQADFTVYDRNQQQKIAFFAVNSAKKTAASTAPLPPGIYSNQPQRTDAAAITVVLLDAVNTAIEDQAYAKDQFIKFLAQIRPQDRVAIYALGNHLRILHDFSSDSKALLNSLARYRGEPLPYTADSEPDPSNTGDGVMDKWLNDKNSLIADTAIRNRVNATVGAMEAIANHIGHLPGRKNLVWITGSFPFTIGQRSTESITNWNDVPDPTTTAHGHGSGVSSKTADGSSISGGTSSASSAYGFDNHSLPGNSQPSRDVFAAFDDDLARAARALNDAGIAVYPVDARGLFALPKIMTAQSNGIIKPSKLGSLPIASITPAGMYTMQVMAENTGGRAFYNTNDLEHAIRDAIDDSELTYTLGFYANPATLDSQFHKLKVTVDRKHADVRFRKGYLASPAAAPGEFEREALIKNALSSPLDSPAVSLAGRVQKDTHSLNLTLSVEPSDIGFLVQNGERSVSLEFAFALLASDGHALATIRQPKKMDLDATQFAELSKRFIVSKTLDSPPEVAAIRIVLFDCVSGRLGSVTMSVK